MKNFVKYLNAYTLHINGFTKANADYFWKDFVDNTNKTIVCYIEHKNLVEQDSKSVDKTYELTLAHANSLQKGFYKCNVKTFSDVEKALKENNISFKFKLFEEFEDKINLNDFKETSSIAIYKPNGELLAIANEQQLAYIRLQIIQNAVENNEKIVDLEPSGYFIIYDNQRYEITKDAKIINANDICTSITECISGITKIYRDILKYQMQIKK